MLQPTGGNEEELGGRIDVQRNLWIGLRGGWHYSAMYTMAAVVSVTLRGPQILERYHVNLWQLIALYVFGGLAGGLLVGLLLPLCRRPLGAALTGFIAMLPASVAATFAFATPQEWHDVFPAAPLIVAALYGIPGGLHKRSVYVGP